MLTWNRVRKDRQIPSGKKKRELVKIIMLKLKQSRKESLASHITNI